MFIWLCSFFVTTFVASLVILGIADFLGNPLTKEETSFGIIFAMIIGFFVAMAIRYRS